MAAEPRKLTPGAAMLASLLVPGLAHFRLGRPVRAAVAFASAVGLFWLGYAIVGQRLWQMVLFQPFDFLAIPFRLLPIHLLPDSLNLGSVIVASLLRPASDPDWQRLIRAPVENEHLGLFLTGASGILSACWAAEAHALARGLRAPGLQPGSAAILSWLLPGAAQWQLGQRDKGLLVGAATLLVLVAGLVMSGGHAIDRPLSPAYWIADSLSGAGSLVSAVWTGPLRYESFPPQLDIGTTLCAVAGFMNLLVVIDAYTIAEGRGAALPVTA
jgi:hypothetical protein